MLFKSYRKRDRFFETPEDARMNIVMRPEEYETILIPQTPAQFRFSFDAFEPYEERAAAWKRRCKATFERVLREHLRERDPGGQKAPKLVKPEHFKWAALTVCGDNGGGTFGWSYPRIQRLSGRDSVSTVVAAVKRILTLIRLTLERQRGRPPGIREKQIRRRADRN